MKKKHLAYMILMTATVMIACASTSVSQTPSATDSQILDVKALPAFTGTKTIVAVLPLGLSERAAKRYPRLLDKAVGLGVHNLVTEALFETQRFRYVEEKPEITEDIIDRQWLSASGFVANSQAVSYGQMLGAEKVIYGEIYDYAEGGEEVSGLTGRQGFNIAVGVQIVCTNVETGEKESIGTSRAIATTYGDACRMAVDRAVYDLVMRLQL